MDESKTESEDAARIVEAHGQEESDERVLELLTGVAHAMRARAND